MTDTVQNELLPSNCYCGKAPRIIENEAPSHPMYKFEITCANGERDSHNLRAFGANKEDAISVWQKIMNRTPAALPVGNERETFGLPDDVPVLFGFEPLFYLARLIQGRSLSQFDRECITVIKATLSRANTTQVIRKLEDALKSIKASADHGIHGEDGGDWYEHIHDTATTALAALHPETKEK